ncbi:MAG: hypothetical protein ACEQSL_05775 [Sediminibacterium sp.]
MKTRYFLQVVIALIVIAFSLSACKHSTKGNWSEESKKQFRDEMMAEESLSVFGANKEKWIECCLSKCEMNYDSYMMANQDDKGVAKLALECNSEVLSNGSVLGNWSEIDKASFRFDLDTMQGLAVFGAAKARWIDCCLETCEANFQSLYHANLDATTCERLGSDCARQIFATE